MSFSSYQSWSQSSDNDLSPNATSDNRYSHSRHTSHDQRDPTASIAAVSPSLEAAQQLASLSGNASIDNYSNSQITIDRTATNQYDPYFTTTATTSSSTKNHIAHQFLSERSFSSSSSIDTMSQSQQYDTPRKTRHPDELHMSASASNVAGQRGMISPREFSSQGPRINLEQSTPSASQYQGAGQLPGALQPGRPGPLSSNQPQAVSPQAMGGAPEYSTPSRGPNVGSHNYTRSSPAVSSGFDSGYVPYSATTPNADQSQFSTPASKYAPQSAQRTVSNTPLGLADIRPRADSSISETMGGGNQYAYDGSNSAPTNSNYLAPWAIYAFDWCKWPAQNHDAGKVAVGSYLEDGHNFVSVKRLCVADQANVSCRFKS